MKKMFLTMVLTVVLGLFVAGFVTAATGGMGWMLPTGTPPQGETMEPSPWRSGRSEIINITL